MTSFEALFNESLLQVVAPQTSLEFPVDYDGDQAREWLSRAHTEHTDRKVAFFDENIDFLLTIRFPNASPESHSHSDGPVKPPLHLLSFLAHLQISYDASYISPAPTFDASAPEIGRPPVPPRTTSINKGKPASLLAAAHPSIFPPATPHPIPSAAEADRQYVQAQGTPLTSGVWGEQLLNPTHESSDAFALLLAEEEHEWVAIYRMSVLVRYMTTKVPDPLLSITISTTLREKPLPMTPPRRALATLIDQSGGLPGVLDPASPVKSNGSDDNTFGGDNEEHLAGFVEVNLLEGLRADPTFTTEEPPLNLPSTRLGPATRRTAFALPPISSSANISQPIAKAAPQLPSTVKNAKLPPTPASATFRKSFRKTMKVVSGFHVRMRTVFVPYFLLPQNTRNKAGIEPSHQASVDGDDSTSDDDEDVLRAREQREAGNEEHTVILSVEIENLFHDTPSASMPNYSFEVKRADVSVSGTGAKTVLVAWGDDGDIFPVRVGPREQVNLLYAVSFLRAPEVDEFSLVGTQTVGKRASVTAAAQEMRRSVSINISVRPFERLSGAGLEKVSVPIALSDLDGPVSYPTQVYASYWSCKLNFSTTPSSVSGSITEDPSEPAVLPTPASPFPSIPAVAPPVAAPSGSMSTRSTSLLSGPSVAGNRQFTFSSLDSPAIDPQAHKARSPINYQGPTAMLNPANQPQPQTPGSTTPTAGNLGSLATLSSSNSRQSFIPPSVTFQSTYARSPTTYNMPSPHDSYFSLSSFSPGSGSGPGQSQMDNVTGEEPSTPRTPAYPAYPGSPPPIPATPFWQAPLSQQTGAGAVGPSVEMRRDRASSLPTPGVNVTGFPLGGEVSIEAEKKAEASGQPIIVSVGLLPVSDKIKSKGKGKRRGIGEIYPLDQFTLDIFVFNQSSWTRRFEVSHPEVRRRRRKGRGDNARKGGQGTPGILPLENRVRIGPLLPSTCQSVRMDFLALTPGVHAIDELILTDIQTGHKMHLRSVMDVVVHEPYIEPAEGT